MKTRGMLRLLPILLLPLALAGCNGTSGDEGESDSAPAVASVARANLEITAEASGQVEPVRVVEVKSKASGEMLRLHVETGSTVPQGALLAEVDPRDVRNAYAQAEADLEVARERLGTAQAQKKRTLELRDANVVTAQELESATLEEANARAQLVKARTNLDLARERLNDVAIRAPIAGTVISKTVEQGSIIASASQNISGGTTLFTMADLAVMQVRALVDETDIGRISPGQNVQVTVEAYPDRRFQGTVFKIEPQAVVEQNVTMFPVLVRLDNPEGLLKPGMNADIAVEIARRENVITVPNAAIVAMRDAAAAGAVLGLSEEAVQAGLTDHAGSQPRGGSGDTVLLCVVDQNGNAVALIQSLYASFGSGRMVPETGIVLHNRGALFSLDPQHVNVVAPGKRTYHTLAPGMVLRGDNSLMMVFGSPGSDGQTQTMMQVLNNIYLFGMTPQLAVDAPRYRSYPDGTLLLDAGVPEDVRAELARRGHTVRVQPTPSAELGGAQVILVTPSGVKWIGADHRREAYGAAY